MKALAKVKKLLCSQIFKTHMAKLTKSSLGMRLARGAFWSLVGAVISRGLALVASVLTARMLGSEAYGQLGIINSTVGMFSSFAGFGLGVTATKYVAELREREPERAGRIIVLSRVMATVTGLLMTVLLLLFAPWLAERTMAAPELAPYLRMGAWTLLFGALSGAERGALAGFEDFKTVAMVSLVAGVANFPLMVVGVYLWGLPGAVYATVIGQALNALMNFIAVRKATRSLGRPLDILGWTAEIRVIWKFSLPAALGSIMVSPVTWGVQAIIANQPNGYEQLGLFNAANQWRSATTFIAGYIASSLLPVLSSLGTLDSRKKYTRTLSLGLRVCAISALATAAVILSASGLILDSYGDDFLLSRGLLGLFLLEGVIAAPTSVFAQALNSLNKTWERLGINTVKSVLILIFSVIFLKQYDGAVALILAYLLSTIVHLCLQGITFWLSLRKADRKVTTESNA